MVLTVSLNNLPAQMLYPENDHVLNYKGQSRLTFATGIPYVGVIEYAYGISDRSTIGVLFGVTPRVAGYGVRVRAVVLESGNDFRVYFCTPVVFYPRTRELGGDAWWLVRPNINFAWITLSGFRYKVGGGLVAAASHNTLFGNPREAPFQPASWNTIHGGISLPVAGEVMFQTELSLVMNGLKVAGRDWVGGPPVILVLGVSYSFH